MTAFETWQSQVHTNGVPFSVVIALDNSQTLNTSENRWKKEAAKQKVQELFNKHVELAKAGAVVITHINTSPAWIEVRSQETLNRLLTDEYMLNRKDTNPWQTFLPRICTYYETTPEVSRPNKIYIISDMENTKATLKPVLEELIKEPFHVEVDLKFIQLGLNQTSYFPNDEIRRETDNLALRVRYKCVHKPSHLSTLYKLICTFNKFLFDLLVDVFLPGQFILSRISAISRW